jgi:hypothetical protein
MPHAQLSTLFPFMCFEVDKIERKTIIMKIVYSTAIKKLATQVRVKISLRQLLHRTAETEQFRTWIYGLIIKAIFQYSNE